MAKKTETTKYSTVLKRPRITEKAAVFAESVSSTATVYTFEVPKSANKTEVKKAFVEKYNVTPAKINMVNLPSKKVGSRRRRGTKGGVVAGVKKALVFLKPGDKIDIV